MDKMSLFRQDIGVKLVEIEDLCQRWGLPITKLTLIARDPLNDAMFVVLTNEDRPGLQHAIALALAEDAKEV
jgi:hypothetical protein